MAGLVPAFHVLPLAKTWMPGTWASEATPFFERLWPDMTVRWLCESGLGLEIDRLRPLAGFDLLAVGGLHARHLEAPVGADHGEAVGVDGCDFAEFAGNPL